jgi:hypothetical protein
MGLVKEDSHHDHSRFAFKWIRIPVDIHYGKLIYITYYVKCTQHTYWLTCFYVHGNIDKLFAIQHNLCYLPWWTGGISFDTSRLLCFVCGITLTYLRLLATIDNIPTHHPFIICATYLLQSYFTRTLQSQVIEHGTTRVKARDSLEWFVILYLSPFIDAIAKLLIWMIYRIGRKNF